MTMMAMTDPILYPYPAVKTLTPVRRVAEDAYHDAQEWVRGYVDANPQQNRGVALGVARRYNGYVGVVNYTPLT